MTAVREPSVDDADTIAGLWAECLPYVVRTARAVRLQLSTPSRSRHVLVAIDGGEVIGYGRVNWSPDDPRGDLAVLVRPHVRGRGTGSALLAELESVARGVGCTSLHAFANLDGHSTRFGSEHGYASGHVHRFSACDPRAVPARRAPDGCTVIALEALDDLTQVWGAHNATAADDPSGITPTMSYDEWVREFWSYPDNEPGLGAAVLDGTTVAAYTMTAGDPWRGHAWSTMTGTRPEYRGRGLATLAKATTLRAMAARGYVSAATGNDTENTPMLAINSRLGYTDIACAQSMAKQLQQAS